MEMKYGLDAKEQEFRMAMGPVEEITDIRINDIPIEQLETRSVDGIIPKEIREDEEFKEIIEWIRK